MQTKTQTIQQENTSWTPDFRNINNLAFVEIKRDPYTGKLEWLSPSCQAIASGLTELGFIVLPFVAQDLGKLPITEDTPVRGSVRTVRLALAQLGIAQPENIDVPQVWRKHNRTFLGGRKIWETTIGELKKKKKKVHIKPLRYQKAFKGRVVDFSKTKTTPDGIKIRRNPESYEENFIHLENDYEVLASTLFNKGFEQRFLVQNGFLNADRNQKTISQDGFLGVPYIAENRKEELVAFLQKAIWLWREAPSSYVIDVDFHTGRKESPFIIVEVNDSLTAGYCSAYAEGAYARSFLTRWREVCMR